MRRASFFANGFWQPEFIDHEASPDDLLKWVDRAKEAGRNQIRFYDANI